MTLSCLVDDRSHIPYILKTLKSPSLFISDVQNIYLPLLLLGEILRVSEGLNRKLKTSTYDE